MRLGRVAVAGVVAAVVTVGGSSGSNAAALPDSAGIGELTFVSQSATVTADGSFSIVVVPPVEMSPDALLRITSHEPVASRQLVRAAIDGQPTPLLDQLELQVAAVPRTPEGALAITVDTESLDVDSVRLQIRQVGLYPLTIELVDGDNASPALTTFVERVGSVEAGDPPIVPLPVGFTVGITAPPTLQTDGSTIITTTTRARLAALVTLLETAPTDVTVSLRPELIDGLARSTDPADRALLDRLAAALSTRHQLLSAPYVDMSPSFAVAGNQTKLFADQLRRGEDVLSARLGGVQTERAAWFVTEPIDTAGLSLLRELGVFRLIVDAAVLTPNQTALAQGIDGRLRAIEVPDGDRIPAVISDPFLQQVITSPTENAALLAHRLLADLSALQIEASEPSANGPAGRAVMFTISDALAVNLDVITAMMQNVGASPRLKVAGGLDVVSNLDRATRDNEGRLVELPAVDVQPSAELSFTIGRINEGLSGTESILPAADPRPDRWRLLLELIADQHLTTSQRDVYIAQLDGEMGDIRSAVDIKTDSGTINLGGKRSKIPIVITNSSTTPLTVLVRFSSSKLDFPEGDKLIEVSAAETVIQVPVVVKSSGRFRVTVQILTPVQFQELVGRTTITAQATVLTGLAQVVTAAFLLILATWWLQHVRQVRRRRAEATAESVGHHPSNGPADDSTDGPGVEPVVH